MTVGHNSDFTAAEMKEFIPITVLVFIWNKLLL